MLGDHEPIMQWLNQHGLNSRWSVEGRVVVASDDADLTGQIWRAALETQTTLQSLTPSRNSLEEIFLVTVREAVHAHS